MLVSSSYGYEVHGMCSNKFRPPIIKCCVMATQGLTEMACEEGISGSVKQHSEMTICQVRLRRMKVNTKPCRVDLLKQSQTQICLPYEIQSQTCLLDMIKCRVRLMRLKIDVKPCRVELARLSHRQTSSVDKTLSEVLLPDLLQFQPQPRTVKQRIKNSQLLSKYNSDYQDDLFNQIPARGRRFSLLSTTSSESDDNMSTTSTSSTGPLLPWPVTKTKSPSQPSTPTTPTTDLASFQHCAFIHQRLKERGARPARTRRSSSRTRSSWRRGGSRAEQFKEMVGQVKAVAQGEENITWLGYDSAVESYFSDLDM